MSTAPSVLDQIRFRLQTFSTGQQKVCKVFMDDPAWCAVHSVEEVGRRAGSSAATVVRTAMALGFKGYVDFREQLQREFFSVERIFQQLERTADLDSRSTRNLLYSVAAQESRALARFAELNEDAAWEHARDMVLEARRIMCLGGHNASAMADQCALLLGILREHVSSPGEAEFYAVRELHTMDDKDLCIAFSFPRQVQAAVELAKLAVERGIPLLLFTNSPSDPLALLAATVILVPLEAPLGLDSYLPTLCAVQTLAALCAQLRHNEAHDRLLRMEEYHRRRRTFQ